MCTAVNLVTSGQAIGAQRMRALWAICVRSNDARETLGQTGIVINGVQIPLHLDNPFTVRRVEGERVVIKDFQLWESDSLIGDFFRAHPNVGEFSKIFRSTSRKSGFLNGDRFVYMKLNPNVTPPIAPRIKIGDYACRVQYSSMNLVCERCKGQGHRTGDIIKCDAYQAEQTNVHYITRGMLSNFGICKTNFEGIDFISSEHAYQWKACVESMRDDLAEKVIQSATPRDAKTPDSNWHKIKYDVMERVLQEKAKCSEEFRAALLATDNKLLIEARQDFWWGSGMTYNMTTTTKPIHHPGKSWLGEILMKIRNQLRSQIISKEQEGSKIVQQVTQSESTGCSSLEPDTPSRRSRTVTSQMRLRGRAPENKTRSTSLPPSRTQSRKGVKIDTPLLKDFLKNQVKQSGNQTVPTVTATSTSDHNIVDVSEDTGV